MNKKFSTLLTAGLLVSGSLFSSAFAEKVESYFNGKATKIESGATYYLVEDVADPTYGDLAISSSIPDIDAPNVIVYAARYTKYDEANNDPIADIKQYQWIATETSVLGKSYVTFKNVATGKMLRVLNTGASLVTDFGSDDAKDANSDNSWVFMGYKNYESALTAGGTNLIPAYANVNSGFGGMLHVTVSGSGAASVGIATDGSAKTFSLYKAQTEADVPAGELNELYNTAGFNLKLDDKYSSLTNLLNQEGVALQAIDVTADITTETGFGFPKGTYFVTETPGYVPGTITADWLLNCTFIAVSSSDNVSTNAAKQNAGEGFTLTTVAGKDLNLMVASLPSELQNISADKRPCGSTINVNNAAFAVKKNLANGKYSLTLPKMYYAKSGAKVTDEQVKESVVMDVRSDGSYSGNTVLVSNPTTTPSYIFSFVESNVVKGTEFISAEGKSIYNIQVGEYFLNNTMDNNTAKFYATGSALADLDAPAYQFVVTKVNGNEVTFTNRAYQNSITVKLFDEGDGWYSLATDDATTKFTCLDIQNNGDVKANDDMTGVSFKQLTVKLISAEAEEISGLDVEDGTQVTIAFARDYTPTSNKMYPVINAAGSAFETKLTDEVEDAAQWQLVKDPFGPSVQTLTYAYLDADDKVAYKTKGDTVAYYTYKLQLVKDGNATGKYLAYTTGYTIGTSSVIDFKINVNKDGSVVLTKNGKSFFSVQNNTAAMASTIAAELNRGVQGQTLYAEYQANDIKTYLVQDAPEVSLPASAKYVTLQSELGNYISMNDEKDGIVVSNDALTFRVFATDLNNVVPSFFISTGYEEGVRDFLFNPEDSVNYYVGAGLYDKEYQWSEANKKAIFKEGLLNETADTLTTSIKGNLTEVAMKANNKGVKGGLNRFKYQIVLADGEDDLYVIRQLNAGANKNYLSSVNDKLTWNDEASAMKFAIAETTSPTSNESVAASEVSVVAVNGAIIVKGAAGKVVTVANILGQTIANQVAASDNVTIAAPAGIAVVTVGGEATKVVVK